MKLNLRQARFYDHWRTIYKRTYPSRLERLEFHNLASLLDATLEFKGGICAIVGSNGVGKSTLLAAIAEVHKLPDDGQAVLSHSARLEGSTLTAHFSGMPLDQPFQISQSEGKRSSLGPSPNLVFNWFDPTMPTINIRSLNKEKDLPSLLVNVKPVEFDQDDLQVLSFLTNKIYTAGRIYEIADYEEFERFPYFEVTSFGHTYSNTRMGDGEIALFYMFWILRYAPSNSTFVVEEPETHISPKSQQALMNILATYSAEQGISVILSTHSPTIIENIPVSSLIPVMSDEGHSHVSLNASKEDIGKILGDRLLFKGALIVEDVGAKDFATFLLAELAPDLASNLEVIALTTESEVTATLEGMPKTKPWLTIVGCYDGNMRGLIDDEKHWWPHTFLPGDADPDELLKSAFDNASVEDVARRLQVHRDRVVLMRTLLAGADIHDWPSQLADFSQMSPSMLRRGLVQEWLHQPANRTAADEFIADLRSKTERRV